ncbi:MAG: PA14 domain-containing protein, partial [Actinomycetota bacterium]|nr:PA14 domain-containing protein [Actinomycetota bacterium]
MASAGGPIGVSYAYNSRAQQRFGLTGTYTQNANPAYQRIVRRDPQVSFSWGGGPPAPSLGDNDFSVVWQGFVTVPYQANNWYFGAAHDDGVTITVGDQVVLDSAGVSTSAEYGTAVNLQANQTVPIRIEYQEGIGSAYVQLWVTGPFTGIVPASWLSTTAPALPQGWSLSADVDGEFSYTEAVIGDASIVLLDASGVAHEYRKASETSWAPTQADDAHLSIVNEAGVGTTFVAQGGDGLIYTFNSKGQLHRVTSAPNDIAPAAPIYEWNGATARLGRIKDPVSGQVVELFYGSDPYSLTTPSPCPTREGYVQAPSGMLCRIRYWDGTETNLLYSGADAQSAQLVRIEDPGGKDPEVTDFGYDGGRLTRVRDPLAADMVAKLQRVDDDSTRTVIAYDGARVASVTLGAPSAGDARPAHSYTYASPTETEVRVAGLPEPSARRVSFDAAGRTRDDRDAAGKVATTTWNADDQAVSATDATGSTTTTTYDDAKRPEKTYGPAPQGCFNLTTGVPNGTCAAVPVATTGYDEGMRGLAAQYWTTAELAGPAALHRLGVGEPTGALNRDWGYGGPEGLGKVDNWSARFTGEITLPTEGIYTFRLFGDDGMGLYIDDQGLTGDWSDHPARFSPPGSFYNAVPGSRHRIRIDYYERGGLAVAGLYWTPPDGTEAVVPGQYLGPRYGLATSSTDADGHKTATEYARPELGLPTATVADSAKLKLRTTTSYENPGSGYLRRLSRTLPAGTETYRGAVSNDAAVAHWRLGETAGTVA